MRLQALTLSFLMLIALGGCGEDTLEAAGSFESDQDVAVGSSPDAGDEDLAADTGPDFEGPPSCLWPSCALRCGIVSNACGDSADCGPCPGDSEIDETVRVAVDYAERISLLSFPSDITDFDVERLESDVRDIAGQHSDPRLATISALRYVMLESRIGHAAIYEATSFRCADIEGAGDSTLSLVGACAVPHDEGMLVSHVTESNPMNLSPGDLVVAANQYEGDNLYDWSLSLPYCGGGAASEEARREEAARGFFSRLPDGMTLRVRSADGREREVEVPESQSDPISCRDPLGRPTDLVADAFVREDGIGVIRLPGFIPLGGFDRNQPVEPQMDALEDQISDAFETVQDARALVWDLRSNIGGASPVGFRIAGGMPGFREVPIARCTTRIPETEPPEYRHDGPDYDLVAHPRFIFGGPVAVLTDGKTISAGDYFARAVKLGTDALLVGSPTAGAYGGSGATFELDTTPALVAAYDPFRCNDLDGNPLETRGVEPDIVVGYDPADLAAGVDTVLERAVSELENEM